MVQVLPPRQTKPTFSEKIGLNQILGNAGQQFGAGAAEAMGYVPPEHKRAMQLEQLKGQKALQVEQQKQLYKQQQQAEDQQFLERLLGGGNQEGPRQEANDLLGESQDMGQVQGQQQPQFDVTKLTDAQIAAATARRPELGKALGHAKDVAQRQASEERNYHSSYAKEAEQEANKLRDSIPRKEFALDMARQAIESKDLSFFSLDKLADITGSDLFRTARGAQLVTAGKENLLSNLSRVSARAQNQWMEQRMASMFPKIGQSLEANLSTQEMIEAEVALDRAYLNEFERLSDEDEKNFTFVRKDIKKRAQNNVKPLQNQIMQRTSYRLKEIQEQEEGLKNLKEKVGNNVTKGTPLTMAMAKLYISKFGDKALDVAKKNGYFIPTEEEFIIFQQSPQSYRQGLGNE